MLAGVHGMHRPQRIVPQRSGVSVPHRHAYGFRNFNNYRLQVPIECGHLNIPEKNAFNNVWC